MPTIKLQPGEALEVEFEGVDVRYSIGFKPAGVNILVGCSEHAARVMAEAAQASEMTVVSRHYSSHPIRSAVVIVEARPTGRHVCEYQEECPEGLRSTPSR